MARIPVAQRRAMLLDAAFRVIASHGVDGATTRAICREAGVTLSTFHYVFDSRDQLLRALVTLGTDAELAVIEAALADASDALPPSGSSADPSDALGDILTAAMTGYVDSVVADPDREQAMISLNQYARQTTGLAELGTAMYQRYYEAIGGGLSLAAELAGTEWSTPPHELAPLVIAATDGLTLAYLNTHDREISDRIASSIVDTLLTHVATSRPA